jgi:hypothetical protein
MDLFGKKISRRDMVKNTGLVAGAGVLGFASGELAHSQPTAPAGSGKPRTLALIGDRYHNQDYLRVGFTRVFKELDMPITFTSDYEALSRDLLKGYDIFLCQRNGVIWPNGYVGPDAYPYENDLQPIAPWGPPTQVQWMTEEQGEAVKDFVNSGKGLYSFHNNSIISIKNKPYRDVMGGAFIGHPPLRPFRVRPSANQHPITQGITEFIVNDEQHYLDYDKDQKYIILDAENTDGLDFIRQGKNLGPKSISGWAYDFGKGRVVFTAVGHTIDAMWAPQYIEIQKRSVRWLLKQI